MTLTKLSVDQILGMVDHTKLKSFETEESIKSLIDEANSLKTYSVCIEPIYLDFARKYIDSRKMDLKIAVVVDFPLGSCDTEVRVDMVKRYSKHAEELDIVVQMGFVKSGKYDFVKKDLESVVEECHKNNRIIKIIVEDAYTTNQEKSNLYKIVMESGSDFIKTGTGFEDKEYATLLGNRVGAQIQNVKLMAEYSKKYNHNIGIKAAGGIHSYKDALDLFHASGKNPDPLQFRLGASSTAKIKESYM
jgi:deoxyribose-phosphate aldolase